MTDIFVFAHMDDETILSFGTMKRLKDSGDDVFVAIACGKGRPLGELDDPTRNIKREAVFNANLKSIGAVSSYRGEWEDRNYDRVAFRHELAIVFSTIKPDRVFTHSATDLHFDHRAVFEDVLVVSRPIPGNHYHVRELYSTMSNSASIGSLYSGQFKPDTYFIIEPHISDKEDAIDRYAEIGEIPKYTFDPRSSFSEVSFDQTNGNRVGQRGAELWETVFRIV